MWWGAGRCINVEVVHCGALQARPIAMQPLMCQWCTLSPLHGEQIWPAVLSDSTESATLPAAQQGPIPSSIHSVDNLYNPVVRPALDTCTPSPASPNPPQISPPRALFAMAAPVELNHEAHMRRAIELSEKVGRGVAPGGKRGLVAAAAPQTCGRRSQQSLAPLVGSSSASGCNLCPWETDMPG